MTAKLYGLRIDLPGMWTDGWLYKDHLILWSRTGQMHVTPLKELVAAVRKKLDRTSLYAIADYLIFRNDWKASEQFERMRSIPGVELAFISQFDAAAEHIVVQVDGVDQVPVGGHQVPGVVLDAAIYANRIYVGSTDGLFETRFNPNVPHANEPLIEQLVDKKVRSVNAWYSVVNSSAGEDGLLFSRMNFDEVRSWWDVKPHFEKVADFSRGSSFADVNLLNYTDDAFPIFMHSQVKELAEGKPEDQESDRRQVTGYSGTTAIGELIKSFLKPRGSVYGTALFDDPGEGRIAVLGNSGNRMLVNWNNSLRVLDLSLGEGKGLSVRRDRDLGNVSVPIDPLDVLDTYPFGKGFLLELPDEVRLINSQGSFSLLGEPVAQIRTFPRSRRHREVILLVRENGVSLLGYYIA